jgi:hypothetical protein
MVEPYKYLYSEMLLHGLDVIADGMLYVLDPLWLILLM